MVSQGSRAERVCASVVRWISGLCLSLMLGILVLPSVVHATDYAYDANGRLVAVTNDAGESARYVYDVMGNIVRVERIPQGALKVFAFTPTHGAPGTPVSIRGSGFSSVTGENNVSFAGVPAVIRTATASQLVAVVPDLAATGPITVSRADQSTTSDQPFVVDDSGLPPSISSVSPLTVTTGTTVTVDGNYLYGLPGKTSVRLGGRSVTLGQASNTKLDFAVSATALSGPVTVQTPYGQVDSAETVFVVPPGLTPANIASRAVATLDGPAVMLTISKLQMGAVLFSNSGKEWLSLQATNITSGTNTVLYTVYAPGNVPIQQGVLSTSTPSIHLPRLTARGTYAIVFTASTAATQFYIGLESNPFMTKDALTDLASGAPSQSKRSIFFAKAGETLGFNEPLIQTTPANASVTYRITSPSGVLLTNFGAATPKTVNLFELAETGAYQVVVSPSTGQSFVTRVGTISGVVGNLTADADPMTLDANGAGQSIFLKFKASLHQNLQLLLSGASQPGATYNDFNVVVRNSAGTIVSNSGCTTTSPAGNCFTYLWYLDAGDYSVQISTSYQAKLHFTAALRTMQSGRQLSRSETTPLALGAGQTERLTFDAVAGESVALRIANVATTPAGQPLFVYVYRPDSPFITATTGTYTTLQPTTGQIVNLANLPVSGRYTVIVVAKYGLPVTADLSLISGSTGVIDNAGATGYFAANAAGQNIYLNFENTQNRADLELDLFNVRATGGDYPNYTVNVYTVAGVQVANTSCATSNPGTGCRLPLWYLAHGKYSVIVSPSYGSLLQFDASLKAHRTGKVLALDAPVDLSFGVGEAERLTFDARAGDTVALQVLSVTTNPPGNAVTIGVYRPDAGAITSSTVTYTSLTPTGTQIVNLVNLPVSGRYTVVVAPQYGLPASLRLALVSGATGKLGVNAGAVIIDAHAPGQGAYLTFEATDRQDLELALSNVRALNGQYPNYTINVYNSNGAQVATTSCATSNPGTGCRLPLWYLPRGSYSVVVAPTYGSELHFTATLKSHRVGRSLQPDVPLQFDFGTGEGERVFFDAQVGDAVTLQVANILTNPAGSILNVTTFRPDAGGITSATTPLNLSQLSANKVIGLGVMPVTGRYTVIVAPGYGLPAKATLTMTRVAGGAVTPGTGTLPADGVSYPQTGAKGQPVSMTFASTLGDNVELTVNHASIVGGTAKAFTVNVLGPSGTSVSSTTCYLSDPGAGCRLPLWNLVTGIYKVNVSVADAAATLSFSAMLRREAVEGALARNAVTDIGLREGEVRRFTFNADLGETVALRMAGVSTTPAGKAVTAQIYRPDAGRIETGAAYSSLAPTASGTLNLANLPVAGAYTVVVSSPYGIPATASLVVASGVANIPLSEGTATAVAAAVPGQNAYLSFSAALGDNLELSFSQTKVSGGSSSSVYVQVVGPTGTNAASFYCYPSDPAGSCRQTLWNLAAGDYSVIVTANDSASTFSFTALLSRDTDSGALVPGVPTDVSLAAGQVRRFAFDADLGATVALRLEGSTSPAVRQITALVYRPDGGRIDAGSPYTSLAITSAGVLNLANLPVGGRYVVVVTSAYGLAANAVLTVAGGIDGSVLVPDVSQRLATTVAGQNAFLNFDASLGDNMDLTLTDTQLSGGTATSFNVSVLNPTGTNVAYFSCPAKVGAACRQALWNLMAGSYRVIVTPGDIATKLTFGAVLRREASPANLVRNEPAEANLDIGEVKRLTFDADAGESMSLGVVAATTPVGKTVTVQVFRPDGGQITLGNLYKSVATTGTSTLALPALPTSGTYTVVVSAADGVPATVSITASSSQ